MDTRDGDATAAVLQPALRPSRSSADRDGGYIRLLSRWWVAFTASAAFVVSGHLLIKAGLNAAARQPVGSGLFALIHTLMQPEVLAGLIVYLFGSLCWIVAVAQQEISFLYPLSSLNYVLVVVASSVLFQETVSARRGSGVVLIVVGMILMNRTRINSQ